MNRDRCMVRHRHHMNRWRNRNMSDIKISLNRSHTFSELQPRNASITILVHSTHDSQQFRLLGLMPYSLQESSQTSFVYSSVLNWINSAEDFISIKVLQVLKVLLDLLKSVLELNFSCNQASHFVFYSRVKSSRGTCASRRSLRSSSSNVSITAGQHKLHEILIAHGVGPISMAVRLF